MADKDLSLKVEFLRHPQNRAGAKFGGLGLIDKLAIDPEKTGATMLAQSLVDRNIVSTPKLEALDRTSVQPTEREERAASVSPELERIALRPKERAKRTRSAASFESSIEAGASADEREIRFERQIETPDFLPSWFLDVGLERARSVCKIEASGVDYEGQAGSWSGSGFLISGNILVTNHHVLNSPAVARNTVCIFNYEVDPEGRLRETKTFHLDPDKLFLTSPTNGGLDVTFCWVAGEPVAQFGFVPIHRHAFTVQIDDCANVIQHPRGKPKCVVVQQNEVKDQDEVAIFYRTDTESGSSGSFVCNNGWKLVALHHASKKVRNAQMTDDGVIPAVYLNEGIKFSAIATWLETVGSQTGSDANAANRVLSIFRGTDALLGFFGALGRPAGRDGESAAERVVRSYRGEAEDIDVGFWNIEWFNRTFRDKVEAVAQIVVEMNLDIWVLEESSPEAAQALVGVLRNRYGLDYASLASEPDASSEHQTTTIIWNRQTVDVVREEWPEDLDAWFALDSSQYAGADDLPLERGVSSLERVDGKIFDRYPALFKARTTNRGAHDEFDFYIVPLHLKAKAEGSKRRKMASRILAAAVNAMIERGADGDWLLGGDLNATLASGDLNYLSDGGLRAMSAEDEGNGAYTYVKRPYRSMIDHVFLSQNLTTSDNDFFVVARDREVPKFTAISDHRPVLARLSIRDGQDEERSSSSRPISSRLRSVLARLGARDKSEASTPPIGTPRRPAQKPPTEEPSLQNVLDALERNRAQVYYDEAADARARDAYYGTLPSGQSRAALYDRLSELLRRTHASELPYKPAVHVYPWVDLHPSRKLVNIYNGEEVAPERYIESDFEKEELIRERLESLRLELDLESWSDDRLERERDELERDERFRFNCEHVVPQSWFNKREPMRGDLHHLFACDPGCNSFRGNIPYFEFADWEEAERRGCGKRESNAFEPKDGKGAVARATMYFLLRYPGVIRRSPSQYTEDRLLTLLQWHTSEPPGEYERHRNAAIERLQGNRNPLIDFPRLAARIDFTRGLR